MSKKPFDTVKGAVDFFKGAWPSGNGVHFYEHGGVYIAVSEDYITVFSNDSPTVFACSRQQFDKENEDMSIKKFAVDTRTITKAQFKALKAAAKAAGGDVEYWRWNDRDGFPIMVRENIGGITDMRSSPEDDCGPLVTYSQALRMLAAEVAVESAQTECERLTEAAIHVVGKQTGEVSNPMKWTVAVLLDAGMLKMPDDTP